MKRLRLIGLAGLVILGACGDQADSSSSSDENPTATREQLLKDVNKVDLSDATVVQRLLPKAAIFDNLEWNATTGKAHVPGSGVPHTGWAKGHHPNGNLLGFGHFIGGQENGPCFFWHPNGNKSQQGGFLDGKRHGLWIHWDETGTEIERENWDKDTLLK